MNYNNFINRMKEEIKENNQKKIEDKKQENKKEKE